MKMKHISLFLLAAILLLFLGACGGGGNNDDGGDTTETSYSVSGLASKGLVSGGLVEVYSLNDDGTADELLGTATTGSDGSYSVDIGDYTGPVLVEITGGSYTDEATGDTVDLDGALRAALASVSGDVDVAVTPLTEIAVSMAEAGGGLSADKIESANELLSQLIGTDITETLPADPSDSDAFDGASEDAQNYALFLAAISQMSETSGESVTEIMEALQDDLSDLELDETSGDLLDAIDDFVASDDNQTGLEDGTGLTDIVDTIVADGLEPTGDLAEAKVLLASLLTDTSDANYDAFTTYMDAFVPASEEAYLFTAMAELMDIYSNAAADFLADAGLTIDNLNADSLDSETFLSTLLKLTTLETDIHGLSAELETRLGNVYDNLTNAEGVSTFISMTGVDTVYLDDIDVKTMKAITSGLQSVFVLLQAVELGVDVDNWMVDSGTTDARDLIAADDGLTDDQLEEFLTNNPNLFTWGDTTKLTEFTTALSQLDTDLGEVVDALESLGTAGREERIENAFNIDSDLTFYMLKAVHEETMPSVTTALAVSDTSIIFPTEEFSGGSIVLNEDDGYSYLTTSYDIYLVPHDPVDSEGITLYSFISGTDSVRDLFEQEIVPDSEDPYSEDESGMTLYMEDVEDTEWDDPIESHEIPEATITIDGDASDWDSVPVFKSTSDYTVKIANSGDNTYSIYFSYPDIASLLDVGDDTSIDIGSVWPWIDDQEVPDSYYYRTHTHIRFANDETETIYAVVGGSATDYGQLPGEGDDILIEYDTIETSGSGIVGVEAKYTGLDQLTGAHFINSFATHNVTDGVHYHNQELMKLY